MNIKKSLIVAGAAATVGLAGITGLGVAHAMVSPTAGTASNSIVDKIATKFNLDRNEVNEVFEEEKKERKAETQQKSEGYLTQAVADGKLTEEQKQKIIAKQAEFIAAMESDRGTLKDKTKEEVRALILQRHEELKKWAEENSIPAEYLRFGMVAHHDGVAVGSIEKGENFEVKLYSVNE